MASYPPFEGHPSIPVLYRTLSLKTDLAIEGRPYEPTYELIPELSENVAELCFRLRAHPVRGMSSSVAAARHLESGANVLSPPRSTYLWKLLSYLFGGFNALLCIAAILMFVAWRPLSEDHPSAFDLGVAIMLLIVIVVSTFFYALVDYQGSRAMASIRSLVASTATVMRDGQAVNVDVERLVVGDIVCLKQGQRVPADLRLIDVSSDARFDRSFLTGESQPVAATVESTSRNPLESKNIALTSTFLARGNARGVVIKIGNDTVIGHILQISVSSRAKRVMTPIQSEVTYFTIVISVIAAVWFALALVVWAAWIRADYPGYQTAAVAITNAIGCLVAFVPEGLSICFALALAIIARKMANQSALVKNLNMVETLGCISVLCSDKTGTLTLGKMAVDTILFVDAVLSVNEAAAINRDQPAIPSLVTIARICNDAAFEANTERIPAPERPIHGDATDSAMLLFAESLRTVFPAPPAHEIVFPLAFNAKNKFMAKIVRLETGSVMLLVKGAPDILLTASTRVMQSDGTVVELDAGRRKAIDDQRDRASTQGHRVIALCEKRLDADAVPAADQAVALEAFALDEIRRDLTLIGLVTMTDPPRREVPEIIRRMRRAGIRVLMITGDFELTASSIASSVGLITVPKDRIRRIADLQRLKETDPLPHDVPVPQLRPKEGSPSNAIVINGTEMDQLYQDDWDYILTKFDEMVFARTTPEQKLVIVDNLKSRGDNFVAVTGDGINDAPALKSADVGVCMGSGTEIAKEAATIILLNNSFSALLVGIEYGRLAFHNVKKVLMYLLTAGVYAEFMAVASNAFLGMPMPLSAFQQIMFCMTNDIIMAIALMYEQPEATLMRTPPRNARTDRLTDWKFFLQLFFIIGPLIWISCMGMWFLYMSTLGLGFYDLIFAFDRWGPNYHGKSTVTLAEAVSTGQCIYYVTMAICQIGTLLAVRTRVASLLNSNPLRGPRKNLFILFAIACNLAICLIVFYGYWIQAVFYTTPIPVNYWFIPFGLAAGIVLVDETRKYVVRTYPASPIAKIAW